KKTSFHNNRFQNKVHKKDLNTRTKTWGTVKFKPQAYRSNEAFTSPDPQATAKPWQHVKNDIIDDSEELSHASRLDVNSKDARQFMQQREQNHRRNIIETNRSAPTKWETFDDEQQQQQPSTTAKGNRNEQKSRFWQCDKSKGELPTDVKNFSFKERNFFRRKLTMGLQMGGVDLEGAINDLKRNHSQLQLGATKTVKPVAAESSTAKDSNPIEKREGNRFQKHQKPFKKGGKPFKKGGKPFQKGGKPFQK
ncbi:hypothetical protein KR032_006006, partial [Drosophila birchii]